MKKAKIEKYEKRKGKRKGKKRKKTNKKSVFNFDQFTG